jgi:TIR domain
MELDLPGLGNSSQRTEMDVFISHSRRDKAFVQKLHAAFLKEKREVWVDWDGIPLSADWWKEIELGIEGANTDPP